MASMWRKAMVYLGLGPDEEYEQFGTTPEGRAAPVAPREPAQAVRPQAAQGRPAQGRPAQGQPAQARKGQPRQAQPRQGQPRQAQARPTQAGRPEAPAPQGQRQPDPGAPAPRKGQGGRGAAPRRDPVQSHVEELPPPPGAQGQFETSTVRPVPAPSSSDPSRPKQRTVVRAVPAASAVKPHTVIPTSFNNAQDVADRFKAGQPVIVNLQGVERELARRLIDFSSGLCYGLGGNMEKVANQVYLLTPDNVEITADERRRMGRRGSDDS